MPICELATYPNITFSSGQGVTGTRRFLLTANEVPAGHTQDLINWRAFVADLCEKGKLGDDKNVVPINIQVGPWDDSMALSGGVPTGDFPNVKNGILVTVQYQYLDFETPWPAYIPRPAHPAGTTLSLQTRGGGQFFHLPSGTFKPEDKAGSTAMLTSNACVAQLVFITEYHITCGRMKPSDVPRFRQWEGCCNKTSFLGEMPETLVFDTWELKKTFVPALKGKDAVRYDATVVLRCKAVPIDEGSAFVSKWAGWNHDAWPIKSKTNNNEIIGCEWRRTKLRGASGQLVDRYPLVDFTNLFG